MNLQLRAGFRYHRRSRVLDKAKRSRLRAERGRRMDLGGWHFEPAKGRWNRSYLGKLG